MAGTKKNRKAIQKKKAEKAKKKPQVLPLGDLSLPVRRYLSQIGLLTEHNLDPQCEDLKIDNMYLEPYSWENPLSRQRVVLFGEILESLSHYTSRLGNSILIDGNYGTLYGGWLASLLPEAEITIISEDPVTEFWLGCHLDPSILHRLDICKLEKASKKQYDTVLCSDLGNLWLYDQPADRFCSVEEITEKRSSLIAERSEQLMSLVRPDGLFGYIHQRIGTAAFFGWLRSLAPFLLERTGGNLMRDYTNDSMAQMTLLSLFRLRDSRDEDTSENLMKKAMSEIICLTESVRHAARLDSSMKFRHNEGLISRYITDHTSNTLLRTIELVYTEDGQNWTTRIMLYKEHSGTQAILGFWTFPDDAYEEHYFKDSDEQSMLEKMDKLMEKYRESLHIVSERVLYPV